MVHDALEQDARRRWEALDCALEAYRLDEVPVGAVLDAAGEVLARGAIRRSLRFDGTCGECVTLRAAAAASVSKTRLPGSALCP